MSSIALRQFQIKDTPFGEIPFAHNYLVRYDDDGNVVSEMHGLAWDPKKEAYVAIGRSSDYLRTREFSGEERLEPPRTTRKDPARPAGR